MSMLRALAIAGAGLKGWADGAAQAKRDKRDDEDRAWQREQRDRQRRDWAESDAEKARIAAAGQVVKPVEIKETRPDTMDDRDVGQAGEASLATAGYDVQGQRFADLASASQAAAAQNTEDARLSRIAQAMEARSPERAAQLRSSMQNLAAGAMQLTVARRKEDDVAKMRDVVGRIATKGISEIPGIYADYKDGFDARVEPGQQGAFTVVRTKDGKEFDRTNYTGTEDFLQRTMARFNPELYVTNTESTRRYNEELQLKKDAEARRAKHEDRMLANSNRMVDLAEKRGAAGDGGGTALTPDATFDLKTATTEAQNRIKAMRDERAAQGKPMTAQEEAIELQNTIAAYREVHTNRFIRNSINSALTKAAGDPQAYAAEYQAALSLGATPASLAALGHKAPGGSAAAPTAQKPAQAAPQTTMQRAQAPAMAASPAPAGQQDLPEGIALDAARQRLEAASAALQRYGLVQRQKDPQGFQAAQAAYAAAKTEAATAKQAWEQAATRMMTAARR